MSGRIESLVYYCPLNSKWLGSGYVIDGAASTVLNGNSMYSCYHLMRCITAEAPDVAKNRTRLAYHKIDYEVHSADANCPTQCRLKFSEREWLQSSALDSSSKAAA